MPSDPTQKSDRVRQAKAWSIALDPVYGLVGLGFIGYLIDQWANTGTLWTIILAITGLIVGFYRFIKEAMDLNKEQTKSAPRTDGDPDT
jgi:F0F1-type ATP synthase assembly protein I